MFVALKLSFYLVKVQSSHVLVEQFSVRVICRIS